VVSPLVSPCVGMFSAYQASSSFHSPSPARTDKAPHRVSPREVERSAPRAQTTRPHKSTKEIGFRLNLARQLAQLQARFQSKFQGATTALIRQGIAPSRPAEISSIPVELLIPISGSLTPQRLALEVLLKSVSSARNGHLACHLEGDVTAE